MILYVWCSVLLLIIRINAAARLTNCPKSDTQLVKIIGLRPSNSSHPVLLYKSANVSTPARPITSECVAKCQADENCRSFVLFFSRSECYWYRSDDNTVEQENGDATDEDAAWFKKVCLHITGSKCLNLWVFEQVPGAILIGNETKILPQALSRTDCQQQCLEETNFVCRSATFKVSSGNHYRRNEEIMGTCILSDADRHILPNSYRASSYDDEYFENQCSDSKKSNTNNDINRQYCAYEEYDDVFLSHSDMDFEKKSKEECQNLCEQSNSFHCRGFSVVDGNPSKCLLHSEDSKIHGPKLLTTRTNARYYEKARCLNISVSCSESYLTVQYNPELDFRGKIYMQGYSENPECYATGNGFSLVTLKMPFLSSQCGIMKADAVNSRILMSGTMIIQYNAFIQTQGDRIIKVGCIFGNSTRVLLGTGVTVASPLPNKGSTLLNTAMNQTVAPMVEMRVLDLRNQEETSDTQIGQELKLLIELKNQNNNATFDIWASHLVAMTEKGDESIFLLDDRGCPTNLNIFPPLTKVKTQNSTQLVATFQAFKFASSPIVRFTVIVQFCPEECPPISCSNNVQSYGRKRRELPSNFIQTINGTEEVKTRALPSLMWRNKQDEMKSGTVVNQMPLEYYMIVRDPRSRSDRLIVGDTNNRILVAGYDYTTNEVCMDYSLVIGLIVTWVIVQIIFIICCIGLVRRYKRHYQQEFMRQSMEELHKNFGIGFSNLENRRVHWADNEDNMM